MGKAPVRLFRPRQLKCLWSCAMSLLWETKGGGVHSIYCQTCDWLGNCPYRLHCPPDLTKRRLLSGVGDGVHAVCVEKASCCQMSGRDDLMMGATFFLLSKRFQFRVDLKGVLHAGRFRPLKVKLLDGIISKSRSQKHSSRRTTSLPNTQVKFSHLFHTFCSIRMTITAA